MWSDIKWVANFKLIMEIALSVATVAIAFFSFQVYKNQLKVMELGNSPKFKIDVLFEPIDNTYERFIQVTNLGAPIKANIDTQAIMTVELQDGEYNRKVNILLKGYFYTTDDMIENGTSMTEVLCKRRTNFCDAYISGAMYNAYLKLNEAFTSKKIPIYHKIFYLVDISYKDYKDKEVHEYYLVGNFQNQEIEGKDYKELLNTQHELNVGDYLNSPVDDMIMDILMKTLK